MSRRGSTASANWGHELGQLRGEWHQCERVVPCDRGECFGTFASTTVGEQNTGDYTITGTSGDTYSYTETVSGSSPFTETENGTETASSTNTQDGVTGVYTVNTTGTDLYTLSESGTLTGGTFAETVHGTDSYSTNDIGNTALQTDTSTTTGGGSWTRTSSGAGATLGSGSGTNGYTLVATGNAISGSFSEAETGTDRYGLVEKFDNVANDASGTTPGNVTFHSVGLPFRDPDVGELATTILDAVAGVLQEISNSQQKTTINSINIKGSKNNDDERYRSETYKQNSTNPAFKTQEDLAHLRTFQFLGLSFGPDSLFDPFEVTISANKGGDVRSAKIEQEAVIFGTVTDASGKVIQRIQITPTSDPKKPKSQNIAEKDYTAAIELIKNAANNADDATKTKALADAKLLSLDGNNHSNAGGFLAKDANPNLITYTSPDQLTVSMLIFPVIRVWHSSTFR